MSLLYYETYLVRGWTLDSKCLTEIPSEGTKPDYLCCQRSEHLFCLLCWARGHRTLSQVPRVAAQTPDVFRTSFFSSEVFPPFKDSRMFPYYLSLRNISSLLNLASYHSSYTGQSIDFCRVWSLMEQRHSRVQCVDAWELHCLGVYWLFLHFSKMLYWAVIRIHQIGQRPEFDNWLLP